MLPFIKFISAPERIGLSKPKKFATGVTKPKHEFPRITPQARFTAVAVVCESLHARFLNAAPNRFRQ
jgi:hypothetical protein